MALFQYQFIQNAVIAAVLVSIICGVVGVIIVEKKLLMMSGGIAHTSYGGVGLGYLLGFEPIFGAFLISVCAALGIGYIKRRGITRSDVVIGLLWSVGMAMGILFISLMPGYPPDMSSYLFGNILSVQKMDLFMISAIMVAVVFAVIALFNYWKAYLLDQEFISVIGVNTAFLEYLLFILIAVSVVALIRVVGIILLMALFTAPPAIAGLFTRGLKSRMALAVVFGNIFCLSGLAISYRLNVPSGAAIVMISALTYVLLYITSGMIKRRTAN